MPYRPDLDAQHHLQQSFEGVIETSGIGLFETSIAGKVLFANLRYANLLGYDDVDALFDADPDIDEFYADPTAQATIRDQNDQGVAVSNRLIKVRRANGDLFWAHESAQALYDEDGSVRGYTGTITDVSTLIETQERLAEAEAGFRRIFERATEGIYRSSLDGLQLRSNPALNHLNGYKSEEEHLAAVKDIATEWYVDPTRRDEFKRLLDQHGQLENFESEIYRHGTRERIWISENAYLVRAEDGTPLFYEGTVREITPQKKAEAQIRSALDTAERANRAKSDFLAQMSHELRTPLNAIIGFSDLLRLQANRLPLDTLIEYSEDIHSSGIYLLDLINDLLDLSRIERGAYPVELQVLDANDVLARCLAVMRPIANQHTVLVRNATVGDFTFLADARAIHQCLLNLVTNAMKASPARSTVEIEALSAREGTVILRVTDQGSGMPVNVLENIGKPFIADARNSRRGTKTTGLGLAITSSLVRHMKGSLTFAEGTDGGTIAQIVLPAVQ